MKNIVWLSDLGDWSFFEGTWPAWGDSPDRQVFSFGPRGAYGNRSSEWYNTIEHAMAAAIAEKHTGQRGAGGTGVGTAADWFMKMIGVNLEWLGSY